MNLLILWSPLADYTVACFKALSERANVNIFIVYHDISPEAPFSAFDLSFCKWTKKYNSQQEQIMIDECIAVKPDIIFMASWNYPYYKRIARQCRKKNTFVLSAFDSQWGPTLRQRLGVALSFFYIKPYIDNFFVPGDRQARFARELGFENPLMGYYSANTNRFSYRSSKVIKKFLYIGRLIEIKGVKELLEAYQIYRQRTTDPWELVVAGTGTLRGLFEGVEGVTLKGFVQPQELPALMAETGCLVLPSHTEPWGVVVHEAAAAGLIIIASYKVGATTWFLRDGVNGRLVADTRSSIVSGLLSVSASSDEKLASMSEMSRTLGMLWSPDKWADYLHNYFINITAKQK